MLPLSECLDEMVSCVNSEVKVWRTVCELFLPQTSPCNLAYWVFQEPQLNQDLEVFENEKSLPTSIRHLSSFTLLVLTDFSSLDPEFIFIS